VTVKITEGGAKSHLTPETTTLNTERQVPLRHTFYAICPTMWSHLMGIHQTFRVIYCFHFNGVEDTSLFPSRPSENPYQPTRLRGILPQNTAI